MPRFHLHIRNGTGFTPDEQGLDLADLLHARDVAVEGARSLMSAEVLEGRIDLGGQIEIADDSGRVIDIVKFEDVVKVRHSERHERRRPRA